MKRIIWMVSVESERKLFRTVLARKELVNLPCSDAERAIRILERDQPDLFIYEDKGTDADIDFLSGLSEDPRCRRCPTIVLQNRSRTVTYPPVVQAQFPFDFEIRIFDDTILNVLRLPLRSGTRHPIRLMLSMEHLSDQVVAHTVNVSKTGMLIESFNALQVGRTYRSKVMGYHRIKIPLLLAKILREEENESGNPRLHFYAVRFERADEKEMARWIREVTAAHKPGGGSKPSSFPGVFGGGA